MGFFRKILILACLVISSHAFSDSTIDVGLILSEELYVGAVECSKFGAGYFCDEPVTVYDSSKVLPLNKEVKPSRVCVIGGEGTFVSFVFEIKKLEGGKVLAKIRDGSKRFVWIKTDDLSIKDIESFMPEAEGQLVFRSGFQEVYSDKNLSKRLEMSELTKLPKGRKLDSKNGQIEYVLTDTLRLNNKKVLEVKVNLVLKGPEEIETTENMAKRIELRKIYFPAKDKEGRINYWFVPDPAC